jgi:ppGpp synthetase/RelA/SpoT-type nucleotidyltranferase
MLKKGDDIMHENDYKFLAVNNDNKEIDFDIYKEVVQRLGDNLTNILNNDDDIFIKYVGGRVKSENSLRKKINTDGLEYNRKNIEENIFDIAGLRVVCLYKDDIERIVEKIVDSGIRIVKYKDYLTVPKASGYSGFHLIVEVPIEGRIYNAEIQIRTLGMDLLACLDHGIRYKKIPNLEHFLADDFDFFSHCENGIEHNDYNTYEYLRSSTALFSLLANAIDEADEKLSELNELNRNNNMEHDIDNSYYGLDMSKYNEAMVILNEIINKEISFMVGDRKLVEHKVGRIKNEKNVFSKFARNNFDSIDEDNIYAEMSKMSDIVGYRLVCQFLCDIDLIASKLKKYASENPNVIRIPDDKIQDFVNNPKENGYSSYHINAFVNINYKDSDKEPEWVRTEIQIRTLAMDFWASYQRKLGFHKDCDEYQELLSSFAMLCHNIDESFEPFGRVIRGISDNSVNSVIKLGNNLPYFPKMKVKK